jgi:hypothetical protein
MTPGRASMAPGWASIASGRASTAPERTSIIYSSRVSIFTDDCKANSLLNWLICRKSYCTECIPVSATWTYLSTPNKLPTKQKLEKCWFTNLFWVLCEYNV